MISASSTPVMVKGAKVAGGMVKDGAPRSAASTKNTGNQDDNCKLLTERAADRKQQQQRGRNLKKGENVYDLGSFDMVADPSLDVIPEPSSSFNGWSYYGPAAGGRQNKLRHGGFRITDPNDENLIGKVACQLISKIPVDRRSIGGEIFYQKLQQQQQQQGGGSTASENELMAPLVNEPLLTIRLMRFDIYTRGQRPHSTATDKFSKKNRSRLRYLSIIRTTNRPLKVLSKTPATANSSASTGINFVDKLVDIDEGDTSEGLYGNDEEKEYMDAEDDIQYESMFTSDSTNESSIHSPLSSLRKGDGGKSSILGNSAIKSNQGKSSPATNKNSMSRSILKGSITRRVQDSEESEISSFPVLLLLTMNSDGSSMEVRKIFELDQLVSVEYLPGSTTTTATCSSSAMYPTNSSDVMYGNSTKKSNINNSSTPSRETTYAFSSADAGSLGLTFKNGDVVEIFCEAPDLSNTLGNGSTNGVSATSTAMNADEVELDAVDTLSSIPGSLLSGVVDSTTSLHHLKENKRIIHGPLTDSTLDGVVVRGPGGVDTFSRREFLLWCLLQIHTMLCTSVVEHSIMQHRMQKSVTTNTPQFGRQHLSNTASSQSLPTKPLPTLSLRNIDRSELQYLCTVNGYVTKNLMVVALLKRQRCFHPRFHKRQDAVPSGNEDMANEEVGSCNFSLDDLAQEVLMMSGGAGSSLLLSGVYQASIFSSAEEEADAQEVINSAATQYLAQLLRTSSMSAMEAERQSIDMVVTGESLQLLLQKRMRQLETDACKRLIAWEDEKCNSAAAILQSSSRRNQRDCVGFLSLVELFATLDELDADLAQMEAWLQDRSTFFRPLSIDCCEIEEENRGLEQQWKSYALLGEQLNQLLSGLDVSEKVKEVLKNPRKVLSVNRKTGAVENEKGIDIIKGAGRELKGALDRTVNRGGLHLRAVNDCVKVSYLFSSLVIHFCRLLLIFLASIQRELFFLQELLALSKAFCDELCVILSDVIRLIATDATLPIDPSKMPKGETHTSMARKIRDVRVFIFILNYSSKI